jgi:hypothetical protein
MKVSRRTKILIGLWIVATAIIAILANSTTILGIVSVIFILVWIASLSMDNTE